MGDLKYKREKGQETYHPVIPIPESTVRIPIGPPPAITIIGDCSELKDKN